MVSESEHEWDRGRQGVWLRGYAARIGVATNLTAELWAWAVRTGLRIALARSFEKGYSKKKIGQTKTKVALLPSRENEKMDKQIENEERGGIALSSAIQFQGLSLLQAREKKVRESGLDSE